MSIRKYTKSEKQHIIEIDGEQYIQLRAVSERFPGFSFNLLSTRVRNNKYPDISVKYIAGGKYLHIDIIDALEKESKLLNQRS